MKEKAGESSLITESMRDKMSEIREKVTDIKAKYSDILASPLEEQNIYWNDHPDDHICLITELQGYQSIIEVIDEWTTKEVDEKQAELDSVMYKINEYLKYTS